MGRLFFSFLLLSPPNPRYGQAHFPKSAHVRPPQILGRSLEARFVPGGLNHYFFLPVNVWPGHSSVILGTLSCLDLSCPKLRVLHESLSSFCVCLSFHAPPPQAPTSRTTTNSPRCPTSTQLYTPGFYFVILSTRSIA